MRTIDYTKINLTWLSILLSPYRPGPYAQSIISRVPGDRLRLLSYSVLHSYIPLHISKYQGCNYERRGEDIGNTISTWVFFHKPWILIHATKYKCMQNDYKSINMCIKWLTDRQKHRLNPCTLLNVKYYYKDIRFSYRI